MRIRSIKPEFWTSEDIASLAWPTRLLFVGLWSYVDDNGVGRDNEKLIKADLFPLEDDPRETLATVSRGLQELSEADLITRYSVDGKPYLFITGWASHQRIDKPNKERYPLPTCGNAEFATPSRHPRETLAPGTGEQRNRGTGNRGAGSSALARVEDARPDVESLCSLLADLIEANGSNRPSITKAWRDAARLMLDSDGRTYDEVQGCIRWSQSDEFWRANVLSMPKLRKQFDAMRLRATTPPRPKKQTETDALFERAAARMGITGGTT